MSVTDGDVPASSAADPAVGAPAPAASALDEKTDLLDQVGATPIDNQKTVISRQPPAGQVWNAAGTSHELGMALEGKQLGHFVLEQFVGGGGMGAVFRGRDTLLGRIVAVKVLSRDHGGDGETLRRFKNEAQSAARLDHENIARVYFVGEDDGWHFIVFEYIEGRERPRLGRTPWPAAAGRSGANYLAGVGSAGARLPARCRAPGH